MSQTRDQILDQSDLKYAQIDSDDNKMPEVFIQNQ